MEGEAWIGIDLEAAGDPVVVQVAVRNGPVELEFVNSVDDKPDCPY